MNKREVRLKLTWLSRWSAEEYEQVTVTEEGKQWMKKQ